MSAKIADVYSRDIMREFEKRHRVNVTGNVAWHWSCICGRGGRPFTATQAQASAYSQRHLRAEHRKFIADLEAGRITLPRSDQ